MCALLFRFLKLSSRNSFTEFLFGFAAKASSDSRIRSSSIFCVFSYFCHFQLLFQTVSSPVDGPKNIDCHLSLSLGFWCLSWQCFAPGEIHCGMIDMYGFHTRGCPSRNLAW